MSIEKEIKNKKLIDPMEFDEGSPYAEPKEKKPIRPMAFDAPTKSFEEKTYILLIYGINEIRDDSSTVDGQFKICTGRTECYRFIETLLEAYGDEIDIDKSKVITETKQTETESGDTKYYLIDLPEAISVYAFCKSVEGYYGRYGFDVDSYTREAINKERPNEFESDTDIGDIDPEMINMVKAVSDKQKVSLEKNEMSNEDLFPDLFADSGDDDNSINV